MRDLVLHPAWVLASFNRYLRLRLSPWLERYKWTHRLRVRLDRDHKYVQIDQLNPQITYYEHMVKRTLDSLIIDVF